MASRETAATVLAGVTDPGVVSATRRCSRCEQRFPADYAVCPRCAVPLEGESAADDPLLGQTLGGTYHVHSVLGEGGMGRVYRARHVRLDRFFALKVLHPHLASDRTALERFRREATAASGVRSPHVAQVVDVDVTADGRPFIVSELLEGEPLSARLERESRLDVPIAVGIARQIARAAAAAHAAGVVHRDLKPDNVFLVEDGTGTPMVKVLDFGIAKTLTGGPSVTRTGLVVGTPAYMAPEQAAGNKDVDARADVYAVGAILYRMLTGRRPFETEDIGATLTAVLTREPTRPSSLCTDLPVELEAVVQRAMAKNPAERFATMSELDAALAPFEAAKDAPAPVAMDPSVAAVRWARPRLVLATALAWIWSVMAIATIGAYLVSHVSRPPWGVLERVLVAVVALATTVPPLVAWVRAMRRGPWQNTPQTARRASDLEWPVGAAVLVYALSLAVGRVSAIATGGGPTPEALEPAAAAGSLLGGVLVWLLRRRPRRKGAVAS
ncbi:MAG: serine/threonine protein kinase [Myxococcota bacterium]|nr:serine/threonine protein kinase [Myxococcota bacterium]MDW8363112.1 serine/threonine-protein kinase [Myxococcales bacterium]